MTYVIIGLGAFGVALAERLTQMGHEVIGVDSNMNIVEAHKNTISSTICININDSVSLQMLPLDDADEVIVTLGEQVGNSVSVVALIKQHGVKRLVARAGSALHRTILEAIGVDEIIMPEQHAANEYALTLESDAVKGVYVATETHQMLEVEIPSILISQSLSQANLKGAFNLELVAVKRLHTQRSILGKNESYYAIIDHTASDFKFASDDRLLLFGQLKAFQKFLDI